MKTGCQGHTGRGRRGHIQGGVGGDMKTGCQGHTGP